MGIVFSSASESVRATDNVISESELMENAKDFSSDMEDENVEEHHCDFENTDEINTRDKSREEEMDEFKKQLSIKREQRKEILTRHRAEKEELEKALNNERKSKLELYESNRLLRELLIGNNIDIPEKLQSAKDDLELANVIVHMREEFEKLKSNNNKLRRDLAESNYSLQSAYTDIAELNAQNTESIKQINALKEVIRVSKTMINLREQQLTELKNKLSEIEMSLADKETNILSNDLRQEYERQLQNIRTLRGLYEERARLAEVTRQGLVRELEEQKLLNQVEVNKCKELNVKVEDLEKKVDNLQDIIDNKNDQISSCQDETSGLKSEMSAVNKLFSQVLLGYKTKQDLDKLVHRLEENHGLLTHMAERENGSEASSALPKLLLELVSQVDDGENKKEYDSESASSEKTDIYHHKHIEQTGIQSTSNTTAEEIVQNLPKVWRVLMELLSHQTVTETNATEKVTTCYKLIETQSGPVQVPSVSQTYIRLKDLIIEKLALIKEVNRMKQLNVHLESRLEEQERKLSSVTTELSKTWHVVGRLRRHHHQLHTHEKILKYELQQKRKLLNELKEELEYCREKWEQAREKNSQSERDWRKLRAEFSSRKTKSNSPSFNNSGESGYSDERPSDDSSESNDESEYVNEPLTRCKKKFKKSFETILDSSTDFNLAAEREDPASDMLDVADLPLDTQDGEDNQVSGSDYYNRENLPSSDKMCEETEDEIGEITNDSCVEDSSADMHECDSDYCCIGPSTVNDCITNENKEVKTEILNKPSSSTFFDKSNTNNSSSNVTVILKSVGEQNDRLAKIDKKPESSEKNGTNLLKETQTTVKYSEQVNDILDNLTSQPTTSRQNNTRNNESEAQVTTTQTSTGRGTGDPKIPEIDPKAILESIKRQNERLMRKDERLKDLEQSCNVVVKNISNTLNVGDKIIHKLDSLRTTNRDILQPKTQSTADPSNSCTGRNEISCTVNNSQNPEINCTEILKNIQQQNEQLAKKDEILKNVEHDCSEVVNNMLQTLNTGDEIIEKLDLLHAEDSNIESSKITNDEDGNVNNSNKNDSEPSTSNEIDHEARFAARDIRLKRLEEQTKSLVNKVNKTTTKGVKIHYKLEELHNLYGSENSRAGTPSEDNEETSQIFDNEVNDKEKPSDEYNSEDN